MALTAAALVGPASAVDDPVWKLPATDLSASGQDATNPQIASSTDGTKLAAVWSRSNGTDTIVQVATSTNSGAIWSPPTNLSANGQPAADPLIVSSTDGTRITAVWRRYNGSYYLVQASTSSNSGSTWSPPTDLSALGEIALDPQITASADGTRITAVWRRFNGSNDSTVKASTSTNSGTTWSTPSELSATGQPLDGPQVTSSADGTKLTAVWYRYNGTNYVVQASTSTNSGTTWSTPSNLTALGQSAIRPQVAWSADGSQLAAVWRSNPIVQASTSTNSGTTWSTPTNLSAPGQSANYPQIASSADGTKLAAIWSRSNGSNATVQAANSTNGGTSWGPSTDLSASGQPTDDPQITSSADGTRLAAIWNRSNGSNNIVQASTSTNSGTTWSTPTNLSAPGQSAVRPQVASSADGTRLAAVWRSSNGSNNIVQAATAMRGKAQKPADAKGKPPARVKKNGVTRITGRKALTNAGQLIGTKVRCVPAKQCRVIRGSRGRVSLRTYGRAVKVLVVQSAPATPTYTAYRKRTVYLNGAKQ